jgi:hypothetical protein
VGVIFVPFQHRGHLVIWGRFKRGQVCVMKFFSTCNWFKLFSSTMGKNLYVQEKYHVKQPRKSLKVKVKCKIAWFRM